MTLITHLLLLFFVFRGLRSKCFHSSSSIPDYTALVILIYIFYCQPKRVLLLTVLAAQGEFHDLIAASVRLYPVFSLLEVSLCIEPIAASSRFFSNLMTLHLRDGSLALLALTATIPCDTHEEGQDRTTDSSKD